MKKRSADADVIPEFLASGGEMGQLIWEYDWSQTSLGPVHEWPKSLRTCVQIMLTSRQPYWIGWGKDLIKLYNDPYKAIVKGKHPWALGKPASIVWKEIWREIHPMLRTVMEDNQGTYSESQLLIMERNGYPEETYYTFSYTPVSGDNGTTEGMICANTDNTENILNERQWRTLTGLGRAFGDAKNNEDVYARTIEALSINPYDFPFALLYEINGSEAHLVRRTDFQDAHVEIPSTINLLDGDALAVMARDATLHRRPEVVDGLKEKFGNMPAGAWEVSPDKAIILPIAQRGQKEPFGLLIVGMNPFRLLDHKYESFFQLIADQVATSLAEVHALEEERKRLEALAEIDRAKTTFFSNISHEFRTPLTLLLGPIQDALQEPDNIENNVQRMEVAYRNALRMQKLVNMLLDFSRIEAGKLTANFTPVDIVLLTEDLVSNFRSAVEKAGMELIIRKEIPSVVAMVDVDMWEKIILNIVSNAFKYSERGSIEVTINAEDAAVTVAVKDTGVGIPESEIEKIFERFHRVQNAQGRSQEGTGIGLAMVKELVKLHNGTISVQSKVGKGSTFTVSIPAGGEISIPTQKMNGRTTHAETTYLEEAIQWIPSNGHSSTHQSKTKVHTVLLADDNADMRKYVHRLLDVDYNVIVVNDGEMAYTQAIEHHPDLILSDIMMPKLDGFGLLKKLRGNWITRNIPVIFLSARAGEEARVEGITAGADDYLTKPFSSRELLARVSNHIAISNTRRKTEKEFFNLFLQSPAHIHVMRGPEHVFEFFHPLGIKFIGRDITGMTAREALPQLEGQGFFEILDRVYKEGVPVYMKEAKTIIQNKKNEPEDHYFNITYLPWKDLRGDIQGVLQFTFEVTETVRERLKAEASEKNFRSLAEQAPVAMCVMRAADHVIEIVNDPMLDIWGRTHAQVFQQSVRDAFPELQGQSIIRLLDEVYQTGVPFQANESALELVRNGKLEKVYVNFIYEPLLNGDQEIDGVLVVAVDVTEQVLSRKAIEEAQYNLSNAVELAELGTWNVDLENSFVDYSARVAQWCGLSEGGATMEEILNCVHPEDREKLTSGLSHAMDSGYYEAEYRMFHTTSGQLRFIHANGRVFYDDKQRAVRLSGIVRDVTFFKMMQQELERQVTTRTNELVDLNHDLVRSNESLKQFAYVASHDLQEPLRKILTYSDLIRTKSRTVLDEKSQEYLEKISRASTRMSTLIKDLLEYSQAERKDDLYQAVDLNVVMNNLRQDYEVTINEKNAEIMFERLHTIKGIPLQINQLFYNLIGNALKFSKEDRRPLIQVTSRLLARAEKESFGLESPDDYCEIRVSDNGIGFEQEFADQIFVLFQRLHVKDKYSGTGIGLALCKKIVENHRGVIFAEGKLDQGSVFRIILPV